MLGTINVEPVLTYLLAKALALLYHQMGHFGRTWQHDVLVNVISRSIEL
jgi:hypothetical protein